MQWLMAALISIVMGLSSVESSASSDSPLSCTPAEHPCRVSSWLTSGVLVRQSRETTDQNPEKAVTSKARPKDEKISEPHEACLGSLQNCRQSSWLKERIRPSAPVPTATKRAPERNLHQATATLAQTTPASAPAVQRQPALPDKPARRSAETIRDITDVTPGTPASARASEHPQPKLQTATLAGPPAYDADTGTLKSELLSMGPMTGSEDAAVKARYRSISLENPSATVTAVSDPVPTASLKSTWLERLGWPDTSSITLGTRVWLSQGKLGYNFAAIGGPDVTSELLWQGQNTKIYEVKADLVVRRFVSTITLGWGSIDRGTLRDLDFLGNSRTGIFSDTLSSPTDGFVLYGSLDMGPRLIQWGQKDNRGAVDFLVGFQYWREKWTARGFNVLFCDPTCPIPTGGSSDANAITETVTWHMIRLGPRVTIPVVPRLTATGHVFYIPWTYYQNKDIHHLRNDLAQDPSFLDKASGGEGIQLEGALQFRVWKALRIEAGYRYWDVRSGSGDSIGFVPCSIVGTSAPTSCSPNPSPDRLNAAKARRQGLFFGIDWTF